MTGQNLGEQGSQGQSANTPATPASTPAQPSQQPAEKVFTQSELNEIVGRVKAEERNRYSTTAVQQPQSQDTQQSQQQNTQPTQLGGMPQLTEAQVKQLIEQHAPQVLSQQLQQQQVYNMNMQYVQKLEAGKTGIADFDTKVAALNLPAHLELIPLLNSVDASIAADVTYDLAENPQKFANLKVLNMMNPQLAAQELNKLAESVRKNKTASQAKFPNEPLGQIKTSVTGADNSPLTVADLKRQAHLRA